jgi:ABC-2 type transport system permease protein
MSATTITPQLTLDVSGTKPVPFSRLVKVELRKSYDTRAGFWLLASMGIVVVITYTVMLLLAAFSSNADFAFGDFVGGAAFGTSVLLPVLGILLVTSEWSQRTAMTTFTLETNRFRVIMAKLVTGLILTLAVAGFAVVVGAVANLLNAAVDGPASWEFGWNFFFGFLITQSLAMLGGFALATLLLNSPAAIVAFFAYKWVIPIIFAIVGGMVGWFQDLLPWISFQTAQEPVFDLTIHGSEWGHLLVTGAIWLALPFALGLWRVLRAEVK